MMTGAGRDIKHQTRPVRVQQRRAAGVEHEGARVDARARATELAARVMEAEARGAAGAGVDADSKKAAQRGARPAHCRPAAGDARTGRPMGGSGTPGVVTGRGFTLAASARQCGRWRWQYGHRGPATVRSSGATATATEATLLGSCPIWVHVRRQRAPSSRGRVKVGSSGCTFI